MRVSHDVFASVRRVITCLRGADKGRFREEPRSFVTRVAVARSLDALRDSSLRGSLVKTAEERHDLLLARVFARHGQNDPPSPVNRILRHDLQSSCFSVLATFYFQYASLCLDIDIRHREKSRSSRRAFRVATRSRIISIRIAFFASRREHGPPRSTKKGSARVTRVSSFSRC